MNIANEIVSRVTSVEVAERYGYSPNRTGNICCPFHGEKTPSLKLYPNDRGFHCFGCGEHGNVIDFTMKLFNLDFLAACARLDQDFNLALPIGRKPTERERKAARDEIRRRMEEKKKREAVYDEYKSALDDWIRLDINIMKYRPGSAYLKSIIDGERLFRNRLIKNIKPFHQKYIEALLKIDQAQYRFAMAEIAVYDYEHK